MVISLYERVACSLIGTPLQRPAEHLRRLWQLPERLRHPELREIHLEEDRIKSLMSRTITSGMNCIDVGCHLGSFLHEITRLSVNGKHIAVEPVPQKAAWLRRRFPAVEVHQIVLGEEDGTVELFHDPRQSGYSSLGRHAHLGEATRVITVECKRLDDIVPAGRPIGFLKIDVEGAEFRVLRGARRLLRESQPVVLFECTQTMIAPLGVSAHQVFSLLTEEIGYDICFLKDWLSGGLPLDLPAFEASMVYPFQAFNYVAVPRSRVAR
jgi:FkbM family methyltransferase